MTPDGEAARRAWARLAGVDELRELQVMVDPASLLGRPGWIAILALDGTITAAVPRAELATPVADALAGLTPTEAVTPEVVRPRLPATSAVLGPAWLSYPPRAFVPPGDGEADPVTPAELAGFLAEVPRDDLLESSVDELAEPLFAGRTPDGTLAAVAGYRRWPNDVAHISILTAPAHRRRGHAHRAASRALAHAADRGLLPQWRARPEASRALARRLGLVELGAQLSLA